MLTALTRNGEVYAWDVGKEDGPFFCPECPGEMILKQGYLKTDHFAHRVTAGCTYGTGESEAHRQAKYEIYQALQHHPEVTKLQLERRLETPLGNVRPDVSFCLANKHYIAIEVQLSKLSPDDIASRTQRYKAKKVHVLWMPPYYTDLEAESYSPKAWEWYLHTLYYGRVYYWYEGETVQPVKLEPYDLAPRQIQYGENRGQWYNPVSKRYRTPVFLPQAHVTEMQPITREAWQNETFNFPAAWLWGVRPLPK